MHGIAPECVGRNRQTAREDTTVGAQPSRSQGHAVPARQLTRYRNEYELLRFDCAGVVKG
jgi:hypothetical protein